MILEPAFAQVKSCPCGYGEAGCLPCEQKEKDIKPVPNIDPKEYKICRCGYSAVGDCIPCKDLGKESEEPSE